VQISPLIWALCASEKKEGRLKEPKDTLKVYTKDICQHAVVPIVIIFGMDLPTPTCDPVPLFDQFCCPGLARVRTGFPIGEAKCARYEKRKEKGITNYN
jgi:hypothetical protein